MHSKMTRIIILFWFLAASAPGATINVSNGADSGAGSLRVAIQDANSGDTIQFQAPYEVNLTTAADSSFGPTALMVNKSLIIDGSGGTIQRSNTVDNLRIFRVSSGVTLQLVNLTLKQGRARGYNGGSGGQRGGAGGGAGGMGGAIFNDGTLIISNCTVTANEAIGGNSGWAFNGLGSGGGGGGLGGDGGGGGSDWNGGGGGPPGGGSGGIYPDASGQQHAGSGSVGGGGGGGGSSRNIPRPAGVLSGAGGAGGFGAGGGGGGAYHSAGLGGDKGGVGGNGGFGGGGGGSGGGTPDGDPGIGGFGAGSGGNGNATGNVGGAGGGGAGLGGAIFNSGTFVVANSTFAGNLVQGGSGSYSSYYAGAEWGKGFGGAIFSRSGIIHLTHCTITLNTANEGGRGVFATNSQVNLHNTIIGQEDVNTTDFAGYSCSYPALNNNLVRLSTGLPAGSLTNNPLLLTLSDRGGLSQIAAFQVDSPVLSAGANLGFTTDQRGSSRANPPSIGAFEPQLITAQVGASINAQVHVVGGTAPYTGYGVTAGLPPGLSLSPSGLLSGTPTGGTNYLMTVSASGSPGTGLQTCIIKVSPPALTLTPSTLPDALQGSAYTQSLVAVGGTAPYTYTVSTGAAPAGVSLTSGGMLSGTPSTSGSFDFTIRIIDSSGGTGPYVMSQQVALVVGGVDEQGIPDAWKMLYFGSTNGAGCAGLDDWDSDGMSNFAEYIAGTDPSTNSSSLRFDNAGTKMTETGFSLSWSSVTGRHYAIEMATNLSIGFNRRLIDRVGATSSIQTYTVPIEGEQPAYYRVLVVP